MTKKTMVILQPNSHQDSNQASIVTSNFLEKYKEPPILVTTQQPQIAEQGEICYIMCSVSSKAYLKCHFIINIYNFKNLVLNMQTGKLVKCPNSADLCS